MSHSYLRCHTIWRVLLLLTCIVLSAQTHAADISVVIDDSEGMCGYLKNPNSDYRQLLHHLKTKFQEGGASVSLYRLSQLSRGIVSTGDTKSAIKQLDMIENGGCDFRLGTSPLHLVHKVHGAKLTLLITDMVFDLGRDGATGSRYDFTDGLARWLDKINEKGLDDYFNASVGLIGLKSEFSGKYYTQNNQPVLFNTPVQRPFYVFWQSTDNKFSTPVLESLTAGQKTTENNSFTVSIAPYLALNTFKFPRPSYTAELLSNINPFIVYAFDERTDKNTRDKIQGKLDPTTCFSTRYSHGQVNIFLDRRCGNVSNEKNASSFRGVSAVRSALVLVQTDDPDIFERDVAVDNQFVHLKYFNLNQRLSPNNGGVDLDLWAPRKTSDNLAKDRNRKFVAIEILKDSGKLRYEEYTKTKTPIFETLTPLWTDKFKVTQAGNILESLKAWDTNSEPELCSAPAQCDQNQKTIGLNDFLKVLAARLDSSKKAVELINKEAAKHPLSLQLKWAER